MPMTILLSIFSLAGSAHPSASAPPAPRVFLAATAKPKVKKDCLNALATALKTEIAHTPGITAAHSAAAADIVVVVTECVTTSSVATQGELEVTAVTGSRRGAGARRGVATEFPPSRAALVTLAVQRDGKPHEFTSGPEMRPLDEATQAAVRALVAWTRSPN
jgi:hypothetical protein